MKFNINILPIILSLTIVAGVLLHDTKLDKAAKIAISIPAAFALAATADSMTNATKSSEHHVHVERSSVRHSLGALSASLPRLQPRDDDRKHIVLKKACVGGGDANYVWPSA